jgi:hypothetical protein
MKKVYCFILALISTFGSARTLEVGPFREFLVFQLAADSARPGDTILFREAIHSGGDYIENLKGTPEKWITIRVADGEEVIFRGGQQAFHLIDPAYLRIEGLIFEEQTANGVNIDDGGTYTTPAHHIIFENCHWRSMSATENNDELKLSGLDYFAIRKCSFANGAAGGSLIDMVGCHSGTFEDNHFENGGSNCIQAKGGTKDIVIQRNKFRNGGERAINIGGSTGLQFFRPLDANYEAANIYVYSNIFIGAIAPIAYVGAVNCEVVNNTIIRPDKWAIRILQETTEPGFLPCGNNIFRNNIIVFNTTAPAINIGDNTAEETFTFSNNLWFNPDNQSWTGPNTPVAEPDRLLNVDPQFADTLFHLLSSSPAIGKGYPVLQPERDFYNRLFPLPRSIGSVEFGQSHVRKNTDIQVQISPNPTAGILTINVGTSNQQAIITDMRGVIQWQNRIDAQQVVDVSTWPAGIYILQVEGVSHLIVKE